MSVVIRETYYNKKPYGQWKNRFIYTMFGLFAGMIGVHDFYAKRRKFGYLHILVSVLWIVFLSVLPEKLLGMDSDTSKIIQMIIFGCQLIGLYTELFIVRKDGDGDVMDDSAGPARILLIIQVFVLYLVLPALWYLAYQLSQSGE